MPLSFEPRLNILPESQRKIWPQLDAVPSHFVLYGGTGIALQLGHRNSEDFDFFSTENFDPDRLRARLPFFRKLDVLDSNAWVHPKPDNLEAFADVGGGPVRVSFFGGLNTLKRVEDPLRALGSRVKVASLLDLAGMKMRVIQMRASWKDYMDFMRSLSMALMYRRDWPRLERSTPGLNRNSVSALYSFSEMEPFRGCRQQFSET